MSSRTRIVVLHMKEIIYTAIFAVLTVILVFLLLFMFSSNKNTVRENDKKYIPGIYSSTLTLNNNALEIEVTVDESHINSIRFSNLDESITTMYPLVQPAIEDIAEQIYKTQSLEEIEFSSDNLYTSQSILNAIDDALKKAGAE